MHARHLAVAFVFAIPFTLLAQQQTSSGRVMTGKTKVTVLQSYSAPEKLAKPARILVYNFDVPESVVTMDTSVGGRVLGHGPIARMRGADQGTTPDAVASQVQTAFANSLTADLAKSGLPVIPALQDPVTSTTSAGSLLVQGEFTSVDQGNKTKRMMIGFGRGASDVEAHVTLSLVTDHGMVTLSEFNLKSESGKKPGAAATMGVGSAAGSVAESGASDKKATVEGDASRMAKAVAAQVTSIMTAQNWIAPPPAPPAPAPQ